MAQRRDHPDADKTGQRAQQLGFMAKIDRILDDEGQ